MTILQVQNVTKIYEGKVSYKALYNVSFSIEQGEFVGIMGPSGSGKTTLLNLISTIDSLTSGDVLIRGQSPHRLKQNDIARFRRQELGFVFQDFNLLDTLTVAENIVLPLTLDGAAIADMENKVQAIAQRLGLTDILQKRTYEISGGQMQRTAIARALIHAPKLLLQVIYFLIVRKRYLHQLRKHCM